MINLSEVTIDYKEVIPTTRQEVEFYRWVNGSDIYASLTRGDRELDIAANGDMYLCILNFNEDGSISEDETVIKYSDDLISAGITDDIQLRQYLKTVGNSGYSVYHENPWWEIFSEFDPDGIVHDGGFYGAVERAIELLFDDDYWEYINEAND
jgi:hypothetical protein